MYDRCNMRIFSLLYPIIFQSKFGGIPSLKYLALVIQF